jgi:hypothetical protein
MAPSEAAAPPTADPVDEPLDDALVIRVRSADDIEFEIPIAAARLSGMIRDSLPEDFEEDLNASVEQIEPIDLMRVGKNALEKVVEFLKHHAKEPFPEVPVPMQSQTFEEVRFLDRHRLKNMLFSAI